MDTVSPTPPQDNTEAIVSPRVRITLLIVNTHNQLLLTRRAQEPESGKWHLPGALLAQNESLADCISRIGMQELGFLPSANDCRLATVFENMHYPGGHVVEVVYKFRAKKDIWLKPWGSSAELSFFAAPPAELAFQHNQLLKKWYNTTDIS